MNDGSRLSDHPDLIYIGTQTSNNNYHIRNSNSDQESRIYLTVTYRLIIEGLMSRSMTLNILFIYIISWFLFTLFVSNYDWTIKHFNKIMNLHKLLYQHLSLFLLSSRTTPAVYAFLPIYGQNPLPIIDSSLTPKTSYGSTNTLWFRSGCTLRLIINIRVTSPFFSPLVELHIGIMAGMK